MQQVAAGSVLDQKQWDTAVTLFTESQCICPHLYGTGDDAIIHVEATDTKDGGDRGSVVEFKFGDRFRGQQLAPKPLSATGFGQETGPRPIYSQTMNLFAMELATAGFLNLVAGQAYTHVPLERKELRDAGAEAAELLCRMIYYHLAGITAYNATGSLWTVNPAGNAVVELDASHRFWAGGNTTDAGVAADAAALLTVEFFERIITKLMSRASGVQSPMSPGRTPWGEWFLVIVDPEGNEQMTRHSSSNRYTSLTLSEIQGGNAPDKVASYMRANAGFQGTRNILYVVDDYVPFGCSGTTSGSATAGTQIGNVRRAMILGRFAAHLKWGEGFDNDAVHIRASYHREHLQESWKFFTHMGVVATKPDSASTVQRFSSATVAYHVDAATPLW